MSYGNEIAAANRAGKTHKERWDRRAAVRRKYGMEPEKRKRGGAAGVFDRNKKIIKPVATTLAGMLGTPALGAAVGAAFGGFDREGKGGIGFDVGGGVKGGLTGYALGKAGNWAGGQLGVPKIGAMQGAGNAISGGAASLKNRVASKLGMGKPAAVAGADVGTGPLIEGANVPAAAAPPVPPAPSAGKSVLAKTGSFIKDNPEVVAQGLSGGAQYMAANAANRADMGQAQDRLAFDERQWEAEQEERKRRAEHAQQLYQLIMSQMSWNQGGAGANV